MYPVSSRPEAIAESEAVVTFGILHRRTTGEPQRKEAQRAFGPTVDALAANRPAVVYWPPSLFHLCPAGG
jgi:hypothetical protein